MNIEKNKNEDAMKLAWSQAHQRLEKLCSHNASLDIHLAGKTLLLF